MLAAVFVEKYTLPRFLNCPSSLILMPVAPDWTPLSVMFLWAVPMSDRRFLLQKTLTDAWLSSRTSSLVNNAVSWLVMYAASS